MKLPATSMALDVLAKCSIFWAQALLPVGSLGSGLRQLEVT